MTGQRTWALTLGLGGVMAVGTFLGFAFGVLAPFLVTEFELSALAVGVLPSVMYASGALFAASAGRLVDRIGTRRGLASIPLLVGLAAVLMAVSPAYPVLVLAALLAGIPLAATNPTTNRAVTQALPKGRRGAVMGWKQAGVSLGAVIAGASLPSLAAAVGWRWATIGMAAAMIVGSLAMRKVSDARDTGVPDQGASLGSSPVALPRLLDLELFSVVMGAANGAVAAYLVLFAVADLGLTPARGGAMAALMAGTSVVARIGWSWAGDRVGGPLRYLAAISGIAVLGGGSALYAAHAAFPPALWLAALLLGLSVVSWQGLLMLAVIDRSDSSASGQASGRMTRAFYLGYVLGPVGFGLLVDATTAGFRGAWLALSVACAAGGLALLAGRPGRSDGDDRAPGPRIDRSH